MNRFSQSLMSAVLLSGLAFAASAQSVPQDEPEESGRNAASERAKPDDRICIEETGSRIVSARNARSKRAEKDCVSAGGRVYTRDDIQRTGSTDLKDALRRLDPSVY